MGDWWGFANAMSMAVSTLARVVLVGRNRTWLDQAVEKAVKEADPLAFQWPKDDPKKKKAAPELVQGLEMNKIIVVLSDARSVALNVPGCLVRDCFVLNPKPPHSKDETKRGRTFPPKEPNQKKIHAPWQLRLYQAMRMLAWAAFGAHVVTIGMSNLVSQLVTVLIIVGPTVLMAHGFGCRRSEVGTRLRANITDFPHEDENNEKRVDMYAFLDLDDKQDKSLEQWNLAPHHDNLKWWQDYRRRKRIYNYATNSRKLPLMNLDTIEKRQIELKARLEAATPAPPDEPVPNARHVKHATA
jgi:hypothetical protein